MRDAVSPEGIARVSSRHAINTVEELRAALHEGLDSGSAATWNAQKFLKKARRRAKKKARAR
jgi:Arc/MetJ-type ribon-helix-helix transcriptional regulator